MMNPFDKPQLQRLCLAAGLLLVCFGWPLLQLEWFAVHSELFSYILLIPVISAYLIWTSRKPLEFAVRPCWPGAAVGFIAGAAIIAAYWMGRSTGWVPAKQDYLALMTLSFLFCLWGTGMAVLASKLMGQLVFAAGLLLFMIPLPV